MSRFGTQDYHIGRVTGTCAATSRKLAVGEKFVAAGSFILKAELGKKCPSMDDVKQTITATMRALITEAYERALKARARAGRWPRWLARSSRAGR